jgi:hypothetical protein
MLWSQNIAFVVSGPMASKKLPDGAQRSHIYKIRVRTHFRQLVKEALENRKKLNPKLCGDWTETDIIRHALDQYFRPEGDPREA